MNYKIFSDQIGRGILGKVYQIMEIQPPHNILIAKIFSADNLVQYNNEKPILDSLSSNDAYNNYIIKTKNININIEDIPYNAQFIIFDYLKYGNLSKYLLNMSLYTPISQDYVKLICLKLLKALKVIHNNDISHNKIDLINIMLDEEFNPIIIHFTEAKRDNNNIFNEDFKGLGKILAILMTNGRFLNFEYYEKRNCYVITDNLKQKYRDKKFWKMYKNEIPEEFVNFFNILMTNSQISIDDLMNNKWLNSIVKCDAKTFNKIENNCKNYFVERYKTLIENNEIEKEQIDINSIINTPNNNSSNLPSLIGSFRSIETSIINDIFKLKIREINYEPKGIIFDYIEISINFNDVIDISNFLYNYMYKLKEIIQNIDTKININNGEKYLSFSINVKIEDKNNEIYDDDDEINNNNGEKQDSNNTKTNNIIYEDENNEDEYLDFKIELLKYDQRIDCYKEKYYLMFNFIDGEICDYYHYLKIIKEQAKNLLKNKCFS